MATLSRGVFHVENLGAGAAQAAVLVPGSWKTHKIPSEGYLGNAWTSAGMVKNRFHPAINELPGYMSIKSTSIVLKVLSFLEEVQEF